VEHCFQDEQSTSELSQVIEILYDPFKFANLGLWLFKYNIIYEAPVRLPQNQGRIQLVRDVDPQLDRPLADMEKAWRRKGKIGLTQ
jgi:hypothetical protein